MAGSASTREGGRGGSGSGDATRSSRRAQGLPPEEQLSLDEVERRARKARADARKVAQEEKEASAQEETTAATAVQDAHQASQDGESADESDQDDDSAWTSSVESSSDESVEAPVGSAVKVEPPAGDRVPDSPQPEEEDDGSDDVQILEESSTIKGEGPLSTVQENAVLDETQEASRTRSGRTFREPVPEAVQARPSQSTSSSVAPENRPEAQAGTLDGQMTEVQAKAYVADTLGAKYFRTECPSGGQVRLAASSPESDLIHLRHPDDFRVSAAEAGDGDSS
jgi:hypothetical protein